MINSTFYLTVLDDTPGKVRVNIENSTPVPSIASAIAESKDLRYSPILPAYLVPNEISRRPPSVLSSIAFFFAQKPYKALGRLRPGLTEEERYAVFFTEGLASLMMVNCEDQRASELKAEIGCSQMEIWHINEGTLSRENIILSHDPLPNSEALDFDFSLTGDAAVDVYIEQISASLATLWAYPSVPIMRETKSWC